MHHDIDGEWNFQTDDVGSKRPLPRERTLVARDMISTVACAVLDRNLHMVETGVGEPIQYRRSDADRRGDEIGVETGRMRRRRDLDEVAPGSWLPAREMNLENAKPRGLDEDARPGLRIQLAVARIERKW